MAEPVGTQAAGPSMAELARLRAQILAVAARHGATNVRVFGSVARGDADAASDVDFLVDFEQVAACSTWPASSSTSRTSGELS
jgi:predicted nucleotidyltransferase